MAAAALDLASRGWSVSIVSGEPYHAADARITVRVLRDDVLLDQPPRGIEAYPTPQMRFAVAALDMVTKFEAEGSLGYIEYAACDGAGWAIAQAHRTMHSFSHATLGVFLTHLAGTIRQHDAQHWLNLGDGLRERIESLSISQADLCISPTHVMARNQGWQGADPIIRRVATLLAREFASGNPAHVLAPGPVQHHRRPDTLVQAGVAAITSGRDLYVTIEGPDTATGPVGDSCAARLNRYVPSIAAERLSIAAGPAHPSTPGTVVLAATLATDTTTFLHAAAGGTRLLVADTPEHRELAAACAGPERFEWFSPGEPSQLTALLMRDGPAATPRTPVGFTTGVEALLAAIDARTPAISTPAAFGESTPAVSVVVPHFNLGAFLPDTLASIHAQTFKNFELIIVDDGSTDPTSLLLLEGLERQGVRILRKSNGGLGSARNAGLAAAKAPWVLMIDADDILHPVYLELTLAAAARHPSAAAVGTFMRCFTADPQVPTGGWLPLGFDRELLANANFACTASCLLRREAVLSVGGYDEHLVSFEDWDLWCSLAERGFEATIVPEFLLFYRQRPDSMYHAMARRNEATLRSQLLTRHPDLCTHWTRAMRIELAMRHHFEFGDRAPAATKPLRYVLADRMNTALKRFGVHAAVKRSLGGIITGHP
jgi:GT2 family glycosyltransferase